LKGERGYSKGTNQKEEYFITIASPSMKIQENFEELGI